MGHGAIDYAEDHPLKSVLVLLATIIAPVVGIVLIFLIGLFPGLVLIPIAIGWLITKDSVRRLGDWDY